MNASAETTAVAEAASSDPVRHRSTAELEAALPHIRGAPRSAGTIHLIVRRPGEDAREVLDVAEINDAEGVAGDTWNQRSSPTSADGGPHPDAQITIMSTRAAAAVIGPVERWPLAGDQIYADLDISHETLPAGAQLRLGDAILEVTAKPHRGCAKFAARFGRDALRFVNTGEGRDLRMRGVNCRVVQPGTVRTGDPITRL
ncbi:MOSC domain-containing protein [Candidatus Poriferisodalis sp.]|uniref:MOSC domain-containing protein n=1 Tax=Candidatus Poriferisodalis sp. TaxID=3101277 RepID=UPI003B02E94D